MAMKLYEEENLERIADSIRDNYLSENFKTQYKPREMATAISDMVQDNRKAYSKYLPKANFKDSEGYIENTTDLPIIMKNVEGRIEQETREGYNICDESKISNASLGGMNFSKTNNKIKVNGTATSVVDKYLQTDINNILNSSPIGTVWNFYVKGQNGTIPDRLYFRYTLGTDTTSRYKESPITIAENMNITGVFLRFNTGTVINNEFFDIMVYSGTTQKPYEPYGSMPSIDYPSEVKIVENVDIVEGNKNLLPNYKNFNGSSGGWYDIQGNSMGNIDYVKNSSNFNVLKANETYSLKVYEQNNVSIIQLLYIENDTLRTLVNSSSWAGTFKITPTTDTKVWLRMKALNTDNTFLKAQLEQGTQATDYVEHKGTIYPLDFVNRNLYDKENEYLVTIGTSGAKRYGVDLIANGKSVAISMKNWNNKALAYKLIDKDGNYSSFVEIKANTIINVPYRIIFYVGNENQKWIQDYGFEDVMITFSTQPLSYVPYTEPYNYPLYKDDYYYKENGKWYVHNEWEKVDLSQFANSNWTLDSNSRFTLLNAITNALNVDGLKNYCNIARCTNWGATENSFAVRNNTIYIHNTSNISLSDFKTLLSTNKPYIIYKLATPINTLIESPILNKQLEKLWNAKTYEGGTNISQIGNSSLAILDFEGLLNIASAMSLESEDE